MPRRIRAAGSAFLWPGRGTVSLRVLVHGRGRCRYPARRGVYGPWRSKGVSEW